MSYRMVSLSAEPKASERLEQAKAVAQGTVSFFEKIKPRALLPGNAKDLMIKDADYSTP